MRLKNKSADLFGLITGIRARTYYGHMAIRMGGLEGQAEASCRGGFGFGFVVVVVVVVVVSPSARVQKTLRAPLAITMNSGGVISERGPRSPCKHN